MDPGNTTLYRIKQTVRKSQPKKSESNEHRAISIENDHINKKSFYKRDPVFLGRGRNLKTIEKEWDPVETKKSLLGKGGLHTKYEKEWVKKKRSATEANHPKKVERVASRNENKPKIFQTLAS